MGSTISIAELRRAGISIGADEAIAIAQKLIHDNRRVPLTLPPAAPSVDNVSVAEDGTVSCNGCEATPGVAEIAILLQALLPDGTPNVPGALRYTIARALHDVDAPPFDSLDALSAALSRHERGDRDQIVRRLVERARNRTGGNADVREERRRGHGSATEYRRQLRAADEQLYEQRIALEHALPQPQPAPVEPEAPRSRRAIAPVAMMVTLVVLVGAAIEAARVRSLSAAAPPGSPGAVASSTQATDIQLDQPAAAPPRTVRETRHSRSPARAQARPRRNIASILLAKLHLVHDVRK